jgi:NitT/TauT family transport system substrate-binding protein
LKRIKSIVLCLITLLIFGFLVGCASNQSNTPTSEPIPEQTEETVQPEEDMNENAEEQYEPEEEQYESEEEALIGAHIRVGTLRGPSGMGMAGLMAQAEEGLTENDYTFTLGGTPEEMTAGLISGELDIAQLPANAASVLYNRTDGEVKVIALNTFGVLFILDSTGEVHEIEDLRGRTLNITGQGATPQFALEHILRANDLEPGVDVEIVFNTEHTELATLMVAGDVTLGMLPQPFVTTAMNQSDDIQIAIDLTQAWEESSPGSLIQGSLVVRTEFLEENPEAVELFLQDHAASISFVTSNVEDAAELIEHFDIIPAPIARQAIPRSNLVHVDGLEMQSLLEEFMAVLFEADPQAIGGEMPSERFFFVE